MLSLVIPSARRYIYGHLFIYVLANSFWLAAEFTSKEVLFLFHQRVPLPS